jgi:FtsZ-binding cell division protein ZapB
LYKAIFVFKLPTQVVGMGPFEIIEKFINEHSSAAILREHLENLKSEYTALERQAKDARLEVAKLQIANDQLSEQIRTLQDQLHPSGYLCDHCNGPHLKHIGNKMDPVLGDLGIEVTAFYCLECGKESFFSVA